MSDTLERLQRDATRLRQDIDSIQSTLNNEAKRYPLHPNSHHMTSAAYKLNGLSNSARKLANNIGDIETSGDEMKKQTKQLFKLKIPDPRCEQCIYYKMIDSGYGHCIGTPPTDPYRKMPWWEKLATFFHIYWICSKSDNRDYPYEGYRSVPWDLHSCKLFRKRV